MKKIIGLILAGVIVAGSGVFTPARAQEGEGAAKLTQGDLAQLLVKKLGLSRLLPASPTNFECAVMLSQNGVFPSPTLAVTEANPTPGWNLDAEVTAEDMAVLLVRALGLAEKVEGDAADIANWVNVLKGVEVSYTPEGASIAVVKPLDQVLIGHPIFQQSPDPLSKRYIPESDVTGVLSFVQDRIEVQVKEEGEEPEEVTPKFPAAA